MITYDQCFPEYQLNQLKKLVNMRRFSSIARVIEDAIISLLTEHAVWGHIAPYEPHTSQPLIEKGFYLNEKEFVRMSVRELLKRKKLWRANTSQLD